MTAFTLQARSGLLPAVVWPESQGWFLHFEWWGKVKRRVPFHDLRKFHEIQIPVSTNTFLMEHSHALHLLLCKAALEYRGRVSSCSRHSRTLRDSGVYCLTHCSLFSTFKNPVFPALLLFLPRPLSVVLKFSGQPPSVRVLLRL